MCISCSVDFDGNRYSNLMLLCSHFSIVTNVEVGEINASTIFT